MSENQRSFSLSQFLSETLLIVVEKAIESSRLVSNLCWIILATVTPPVTPQRSLSGTLLNITNPASSPYPAYTPYSYSWTANGVSATLAFFFRNDPGGWQLDDITVYHGSMQLIRNGGFETGDLTGWNYSGRCYYYTGQVNRGSWDARSGSWYYYGECSDYGDTINQTFPTVAGDTYIISFWLTNDACCSWTEIATATIT